MKFLKTILWIATVLLVGYYFYNILQQNWQQIIHLKPMGSMTDFVFLIAFALLVYLTNSLSWHLITKAVGAKLTYIDNLEIWVLSNASRFIPGVIWQYAGRVYLADQKGLHKVLAIACIQIEGLFTIFAGTFISFLVLQFWQPAISPPINQLVNFLSTLGLVGAVIFLLIFTKRSLLKGLSNLLERVIKKEVYLEQATLPLAWLPIILISFLSQFLIDGAVLLFLARSLFDVPLSLYPLFVATFAISWMIGYLSVFAPSGLGVQEITMTALLSLIMPAPFAVLVTILFRVVLLISELITILLTKLVVARS